MLPVAGCSRGPSPEARAAGSSAPPGNGSPPAAASAVSTSPSSPETGPAAHFNGDAAMQYVRQVVAFGPRPAGSAAHQKLENFLRSQLKADSLEEDAFTASTPLGPQAMRNFIAKFPGRRDGVVVVAGHYDTKLLKDFVGANDGGSSTALLLELAKQLRSELKNGKRAGYSVWIVFLDGEEAFQEWTAADSLYGSRHLAEKWQAEGTLKQIQAFLLVDMIGDAGLDIVRDLNSTAWLEDLLYQAARRLGYQSHFFAAQAVIDDDHRPFAQRGVPVADIIDFNYGYNNAFWHTTQDTLDKLSPKSFTIVGSVVLETLRLLDVR
jgi:glutaminyl-peptide cyclotransferase